MLSTIRFCLVVVLGALASSVVAYQPAAASDGEMVLLPGNGMAFVTGQAWQSDWRSTPDLVSLKVQGEKGSDTIEGLRTHLAQLGLKTFSNREWKAYWDRQKESAQRLADALQAENVGDSSMRVAMVDWVGLATAKVVNQDLYFNAIEAARDAAEERLEAALEMQGSESQPLPSLVDLPTPYERRKLKLAGLLNDIEVQKAKRQLASAEHRYIERQLESEKKLNEALAIDVNLAAMELNVSSEQVRGTGPDSWRQFWREIEKVSGEKYLKLTAEAKAGGTRQRTLEVELALGASQLGFRTTRIDSLQREYDENASFDGWLSATSETFLNWLRQDSWRLLLGLFLIWVGVRVALRFIGRLSDLILARAEGNPDDPTDVDQRSKTLASVFTGIARIAVFIIGGLLALEQIGISTGPLLGSVAILGLAVSFGSQNLVRDVVNGFFILLENQYAVGEWVVIAGNSGTVEKITIRSTWIRAWTGEVYVIPNGTIGSLTNKARDWAVAPVHVGVGYGADLDKVREVVNKVGEQVFASEDWKDILEEAPTYVGVTELADSSVTVRVVARVRPGSQGGISRELNYRLKLAFDEAGIDIPYPQRVIHQANS